MKFAGLILICASSSLALLLPALGVVKFPMLSENQSATANHTSTQSDTPNSQTPGLQAAAESSASSILNPNAPNPGLPVIFNQAPQPTPSIPQLDNPNTQNNQLGKLPFTDIPTQKVGLGAWLLLAPTLLVGLAMWTFSPPPKSPKN
jgi:hypothetical protein